MCADSLLAGFDALDALGRAPAAPVAVASPVASPAGRAGAGDGAAKRVGKSAARTESGRGVGAPNAASRAVNIDRVAAPTSNHFGTVENPEFARECVLSASEASDDKSIDPTSENAAMECKHPSESISEEKASGYVMRTTVPVLPSQLDPSKRTPNYKEPTPESEWKSWWKPRKRPYGSARGWQAQQTAIAAVEEALGMEKGVLDTLPKGEDGVPLLGPALADALVAFVAQGGTLSRFATATGVTRTRLWSFIKKPGLKERYLQARKIGVDAIAEEALQIASEPVFLEDTYESYDGNGNLVRRDVKTGDAAYARKLAFTARLELLKRWAPEKYGDKVEVQTTDSMAAKILAARKRIMGA